MNRYEGVIAVCAVLTAMFTCMIFIMLFFSPQSIHETRLEKVTCYVTAPGGLSCVPNWMIEEAQHDGILLR